jgi:hypothetical protein
MSIFCVKPNFSYALTAVDNAARAEDALSNNSNIVRTEFTPGPPGWAMVWRYPALTVAGGWGLSWELVFVVGVNGPVSSGRVAVCQPATWVGDKTIAGRSAATYVLSGAGFSVGELWRRAALATLTGGAVPHEFRTHAAAIAMIRGIPRMAACGFVTRTVLRYNAWRHKKEGPDLIRPLSC